MKLFTVVNHLHIFKHVMHCLSPDLILAVLAYVTLWWVAIMRGSQTLRKWEPRTIPAYLARVLPLSRRLRESIQQPSILTGLRVRIPLIFTCDKMSHFFWTNGFLSNKIRPPSGKADRNRNLSEREGCDR
jgi:hypothetical protein